MGFFDKPKPLVTPIKTKLSYVNEELVRLHDELETFNSAVSTEHGAACYQKIVEQISKLNDFLISQESGNI